MTGRVVLTMAVFAAATAVAAAAPQTELVSVDRTGVAPAGNEDDRQFSEHPSITADGGLVAFQSDYSTIVAGEDRAPNAPDVFVRDMAAGATSLVDVNSDEVQTTTGALGPAIAGDGRFVAFSSTGNDLVEGKDNTQPCTPIDLEDDPDCGPEAVSDIFVRDLQGQTTERVSITSTGKQGDGDAFNASISDDGRFVAFESHAPNFWPGAPDDREIANVYVRDRKKNVTRLVSETPKRRPGDQGGEAPFVSGNGRYVLFGSMSHNLLKRKTKGYRAVFRRDLVKHRTVRVDVGSSKPAKGAAFPAGISASGRYVLFTAGNTTFVKHDDNKRDDAFLRDMKKGRTRRVSLSSSGKQLEDGIQVARLSADGRHVIFSSLDSAVVPDRPKPADPEFADVYVRDVRTGDVARVSAAKDGGAPNGYNGLDMALSAHGEYATWVTRAFNLVDNDKNLDFDDVYRRGPLG